MNKNEKMQEPEFEDEITQAAQKTFGITYLYPWQRLVIANILCAAENLKNQNDTTDEAERGNQIVLLPTGAGKSLCFMVPALFLEGATLIFYPLLSLMNDQERRMSEGGFEPVVFRGQQTKQERENNFAKIKNGSKFILANPEVLQSAELLEKLSTCGISHIAIDEAHCVSEWGDSFRPAYLELGNIIKKLNVHLVTAFTATASPSVLERISHILFDGHAHLIRSDSDRPNILYKVQYAYIKEKLLLECVLENQKPLIVFCSTRKKTEDTARILRDFFYFSQKAAFDSVRFYHAGLTKEEKIQTEKWFYDSKDGILTATCAFGMGVDKKDIKTVIHLEAPKTAEAYIQEAGRGGRDGSNAQAILLWSPEDSQKSLNIPKNAREKVLADFAQSATCRRQVLLNALGAEEAACSGCDICDKTADFSFADKNTAIDLLKRVKKRATKIEFEKELSTILNKKSQVTCGMRIWEEQDIHRLTQVLIQQKQMRIRKDFLFKNTVDFFT